LSVQKAALDARLAEDGLYAPERKTELLRLMADKAEVERAIGAAELDWMEALEAIEGAE
jgi:hypothetical protein